MSIITDTRAQSVVYIKALGTLILFSAFYGIFNNPVSQMLSQSERITTTTQAATGRSYVASMWDWLPLAVLGLLVLWVIMSSIRQSGGGV